MAYNHSYSKKPGTISYSLARFVEGVRNPDNRSIMEHFTNISEFLDVIKEIEPEIDLSSKATREVFKLLCQKLEALNEHPTSKYCLSVAMGYFSNIYLKGDGFGVLRSNYY